MNKNENYVLVMGGFGFLGSHLCRSLLLAGYKVRALGRHGSSKFLIKDIVDKIEIVEADIGNASEILLAMKDIDVVIHAVHTTVPGSSMLDPEHDIISNVSSPVVWMSRLNETAVRKIIYISSGGTVYGVPKVEKITESHTTNPICSYGITKLMNEKYLSMYASMYDKQCIIIRPSNIYGEGQRLDKGQGVIGVLLNRILYDEKLEIWGSGKALRDYIYIDDAISGIKKLVSYDGKESAFNLSSGIGYSVLDIIDVLQSSVGQQPTVEFLSGRGFDVPVNVLDSSRLSVETGWKSVTSLSEGIHKLILSTQYIHEKS